MHCTRPQLENVRGKKISIQASGDGEWQFTAQSSINAQTFKPYANVTYAAIFEQCTLDQFLDALVEVSTRSYLHTATCSDLGLRYYLLPCRPDSCMHACRTFLHPVKIDCITIECRCSSGPRKTSL